MISKLGIEVINSLTISELDALKYIEANKKSVLNMSIHDLSLKTYVSTATIMRLCKKIGFNGFSELKYYLKDEIKLNEIFKQNDSFDNILKMNLEGIVETSKMIDEASIQKVIDWMGDGKKIHFFAKGLTSIITEYTSKQLLTFSRENYNYHDTHIAYLSAEKMSENDLVFLCSLSGRTHQILRMGQIAKGMGAKIVTITSNIGNELSKIGDVNFHIYASDDSKCGYDIASRLPMLFILNIIINYYIQMK